MKIDEAIKILTIMGKPEFEGHTEDILTARQLGIEALKVVKLGLAGRSADITLFQKGETEE